MQSLTFEEVRETVAVIGTPQQCIERITWLREEFEVAELICWFNPGGLMPAETVQRSMSRFATHVARRAHVPLIGSKTGNESGRLRPQGDCQSGLSLHACSAKSWTRQSQLTGPRKSRLPTGTPR